MVFFFCSMSSGDAVAEPGISDTIMTPLDNTNRTNIGENSEPKASVQNVGSNSCVKSTENMLNVNSGESSEIRTSDCLNELEIKNKGNATTVNFTKGEESECNGDKLNNDGNNIKNNNSIMNDCNLRTITKEELLALPEKELWEKWQFLIKKLEVLDTQLQSQINTPGEYYLFIATTICPFGGYIICDRLMAIRIKYLKG